NTLVIPVPTVTYTSPNAIGSLTFTPAANAFGVSTITVTVEDGGLDGNLATVADNLKQTTSFTVTVTSVNDTPVAASGNYQVDEGDTLTLNAGPSFDVDEPTGDILIYSWDLNGDGTYDINSGTATTAVVTWAQLTQFGITAPSVRQIRLRVTDASNASSTVLVQLSTLIVDYGDAPNTYGTLKANNGAAHTINGVLFLGSSVDKETNGQPSATATGDGADEDGVTLTSTIEASPTIDLPSLMTVVSSAAGKLDAWLDFNNNGIFEAGEHLNDGISYSVVGGANRLSFIVPNGTSVGSRMMRFRLSSAGGLAPTGRAADGEVEDYRVSIQALQAPVTPAITRPIDSLPNDGQLPQTSDLTPLIEWTQSNANFFYNVDVRNSANVSVFSRTGLTTTSVAVDRNLLAGVYTVRLTALNRGNVAAPVATYSFRVVPIEVTAPATDVGTLRPQITWTAVAGTKSYFVEVTSVLTGNIVHSATILTSGVTPPALPNQYTLPVNLPLGSYRVRVRATDAADLPGDFSAIRTFNVRAATTVTGPVGSIDVRRPTITWNAIPGAVSYRVQLDNMTDNVSVLNPVSGITSTSWIVPVDLKLAEYRVRVTGFTANGIASFESAPWTFRVTPATTTLTPLGRLPDSTPTFGWNVIAGADQYELIVRNKRYDSTAVVISQLSLNTTSFTQPTNLPLGRYTYQIRGINNPAVAGQAKIFSAYSPVYEFVITAPPVITQPQDATFSTRPVFQWTNPLGSEKNDLVVTQVGVPGTFLAVNGITGTSLTSTKDFGVGTYVVQVRTYSRTDNPATAADEREVSDWSLPRTFRVTTAPAIIGPSGRTADSTPTLTWQAVLGAQSYEVSINSDTFGIMDVVTASGLRSLSYTVTAGLPIGRYSWKVRAAGPSGVMSAYSTIGRFEIVAPPSFTSVITQTLDSTPTLSWTSLAGMLKGNPAGAASYELVIYDTRADNSVIREAFRRTGILGTSFTVPTALTVGKHRAIVKATTFGLPGATGAPTVTDDSAPLDFYVITDRPVVAAIGTTTDTTPTISWTPVNGATRYNLRITTGTTPDSGIVRQANAVNGLSYTVPTALARGTYRVWVQAISSTTGVAGAWSSVVTMVIADADSSDQSGSARIDDVTTTTSGQSSEFILTAHLDTAVSMIPATIVTGDRLESSDLHRSVRELSGAALTAEVDGTASGKELDVTSGELLTQKDAVLSDWDSEAWWDVPSSEPSVAADDTLQVLPMTTDVVAPSQAEPSKSDDSVVTASAGGFLGMILAWTHGSVRNRFRRSVGVKNETDTE
ncbi:MAG: GEVED domain-containing protein, partial [Planctomyces sp.]